MKVLVVLACVSALAFGANPGFRLRIGQTFLDALAEALKETLNHALEKLSKDENSVKLPPGIDNLLASFPIEGEKHIHKVELVSHSADKHELKWIEPDAIGFEVANGNLKITLHVGAKSGDTEQNGTVTGEIKNLNGKVVFSVTEKDGKPVFSKKECEMSVEDFSLSASGFSTDEEINTVLSELATTYKSMLSAACPSLNAALSMVNKAIESRKPHLHAGGLLVDMSLVNPPKMTADYGQLDFNGCTHAEGEEKSDEPYEPEEIVESEGHDHTKMFTMWATETMSNTFMREWHNHGKISMKIDKSHENYEKWGVKEKISNFMSAMGVEVPADADVEAEISSAAPPTIDYKPGDKDGQDMKLTMAFNHKVKFGDVDFSCKSTGEGYFKIEVMQADDETPYPRANYSVEITKLELSDISGVDVTDEQKEAAQEKVKKAITKFMNGKMYEFAKEDNERMEKWARIGKVTDLTWKVNENNFEASFNVDFDAKKMVDEFRGELFANFGYGGPQ